MSKDAIVALGILDVWLGSSTSGGFFVLAILFILAEAILFRPGPGREEVLRRPADRADLVFRTASIGIVFGARCLVLRTFIGPARVRRNSLPRNLKMTRSMVLFFSSS